MSPSGKWWHHVVINTRGSWLPGDPRGFRSRHHKIHSSGDYRNPPPPGEHEGLFAYTKKLCPNAITIPDAQRGRAGQAIVAELAKQGRRLLVLSVGGHHTHLLAELPRDEREQWDIVGDCKRVASHAIRDCLPGRVWAVRGLIKPIRDREHHRRVYHYILEHSKEGAWVWSFRDGGC